MKRILLLLLVLSLLIPACGDDQPEDAASPTATPTSSEKKPLTLMGPAGSEKVLLGLKLMLEATGFGYSVTVLTGDATEDHLQELVDGSLDLLIVMQAPDTDLPVTYTEFVRTTICLFVPATSPITDLTREQAAAIFSGEVTDWSEVSGPEQPIQVVLQPQDNAVTSAFTHGIMQGVSYTDDAQMAASIQEAMVNVATEPGAIGYGNLFDISIAMTGVVRDLTLLNLDGVAPTEPSYPVASSIGLAYSLDRAEEMQPIMDWILGFLSSGVGQQYLASYGISVIVSE